MMRVVLGIVAALSMTTTAGVDAKLGAAGYRPLHASGDRAQSVAMIRAVLFKIRDVKSLRRYSAIPLHEIHFFSRDMPPTDPFDPFAEEHRPTPRTRLIRESITYDKIDHDAWEGVAWLFDLLRHRHGDDPAHVECSATTLCCEVSEREESAAMARCCFVRTASGPKLQRIEVEPKQKSMGGI